MADVRSLGDGRFLVSDGTRQRIAYAVRSGQDRWVFLNGRTYVITSGGGGRGAGGAEVRGGAHDNQSLAAPMPATVSSVKVKTGDQVARGDVLVMLEAMKMELPIKAPRDGRVTAIACREGELVQPGVPLVEIE